ncbi:MAG: hypothetical protein JXR71_07890 [Bacteroidales bacterium]|nr:hypothetical protein [Bacteroidales bacterium]
MNKANLYPQIIILKGFGTFSSKELEFESHFEVVHYPQNTIITTNIEDSGINFLAFINMADNWELNGSIENNLTIHAENLLFTNLSENILTLLSFKDLTISKTQTNKITSAEFPLVGLYKGDFKTKLDNWEIECSGEKENGEKIKKQSKNWNIQLEGLNLKLINPNSTKEEFISKANDITSLLSLALGNDIIFNRQKYYQGNELIIENWRRKADHHFGTEACVPHFTLDTFLKKTLHNYEKWNEKKRKIFFATVTGINSSSKGFLEDRILRICVSWEGLAGSWSKNKKKPNSELKPLKELLNNTVDTFSLPPNIDKNFIKTRISDSLDWEKSSDFLTKFSGQYLLDSEKLKLDFKSLVKVRNDIAHSGLFKKKYTTDFLTDLIYNHKLGLQIILLKELEYDGLVVTSENKWTDYTKIEELIKPSL